MGTESDCASAHARATERGGGASGGGERGHARTSANKSNNEIERKHAGGTVRVQMRASEKERARERSREMEKATAREREGARENDILAHTVTLRQQERVFTVAVRNLHLCMDVL